MLFSELFSVYYNTVAEILKNAVKSDMTEQKLKSIVAEKAFGESVMTIPGALKSGQWQLMKPDLTTPLTSVPTMPLTTIKKCGSKRFGTVNSFSQI